MKYLALNAVRLLLTLILAQFYVGASRARASDTEAAAFDHAHSSWNRVLNSYVTVQGPVSRVNYARLKGENPADLYTYINIVEKVTRDEFSAFSEKQRLAFLINAYNALTVKLILDHYPVKSIREIGGTFSSPWKMKFFTLFGEKRHLDDIQHGMVRKEFNEPRIHFALVCASKGCPALRTEAFMASRLDEQLNDSANLFLRDSSRNRFEAKDAVLSFTKLFAKLTGVEKSDVRRLEDQVLNDMKRKISK